jgi:hypothetical protein
MKIHSAVLDSLHGNRRTSPEATFIKSYFVIKEDDVITHAQIMQNGYLIALPHEIEQQYGKQER